MNHGPYTIPDALKEGGHGIHVSTQDVSNPGGNQNQVDEGLNVRVSGVLELYGGTPLSVGERASSYCTTLIGGNVSASPPLPPQINREGREGGGQQPGGEPALGPLNTRLHPDCL